MNQPFKFKQFTIHQEKSAMKVGTDGVLLGAWASLISKPVRVLDIGSGTGVIALMLAQRSAAQQIDAVELNAEAYVETVENFERSQWADRLFCYHASFQQFATEIEESYDLIISNPPFYNASYQTPMESRTMARHAVQLNYEELISGTAKLLSEEGTVAFIIPFSEEEEFIELARENHLFPARLTRVRGRIDTSVKRTLIQLEREKQSVELEELVIEIQRHVYTTAYKKLVKDFYLKM